MHHHVVFLSSLSLLLSVTTVHIAGSISTVIVTSTEPVTKMAASSCTPSCNNSPTASEVEVVDVNLKSTSSASRFSPPHALQTSFCPILTAGGTKRNPSGHTLCKNHPARSGGSLLAVSVPRCYHWIIPRRGEAVTHRPCHCVTIEIFYSVAAYNVKGNLFC